MNTLEGMNLLVEAVDSGSFSAAGRRLGLAPSSVTRRIGALEDDLGVRLLNRTTRSLSLTEAGRLYHERAQRILAEVEEAKISVTRLEANPRGTLRLNAPSAFGRAHIAPLLPSFLSTYPDVKIDLSMTDAFIDPVEEGVDLVIRIGELKDFEPDCAKACTESARDLRKSSILRDAWSSDNSGRPSGSKLPDLQAE